MTSESRPKNKRERERERMAVVGVDFGNLGSRIAVAQNRGIDTITNEVNNRTTPSLVQFNGKNYSHSRSHFLL